MMKRAPSPSPLAFAAILAASAIPFTPALAQEVQPDLPTATAQLVLPAPADPPAAAAPIAAEPVIAASPSASAEPAAKRAPTRAARPTSATAKREATPATAPVSASVSSRPPVTPSASPAAPDMFAPAPVVAKAAPAPVATADNNNSFAPLALGGVVIAGALAGATLITRRRRKARADEEALYEEPYPEPQGEAEAEPAFADEAIAPAPLFAANASDVHEWHHAHPAPSPHSSGAIPAGPVPTGPVPTGKAREVLIAQMVAAPPDADNPFSSTVKRRKRARMLLAAQEARQREAATEPFDFRTYKPFSETEAAEPSLEKDLPPEKASHV